MWCDQQFFCYAIRRNIRIVAVVFLLSHAAVVIAADWPMKGRDNSRNAVSPEQIGPLDWQVADDPNPARNTRWIARLGAHSHGDPVVSGGLVWVGTDNGYEFEGNGPDASVLTCLDERDGQVLYRYVSPRLESRDVDWGMTSLASSPLIEGDRLWFCNNRCEVICLDIGPLLARTGDPRIVWKVDMRAEFGVVPAGVMIGSHVSHCSIAEHDDLIYVNTTNAAHPNQGVLAPEAPSLICFEKRTGAVRWQDNSPGDRIIHIQHGSPMVAEIGGQWQVVMGQGDGWVRGFDAMTGEVLWSFDINPKSVTRYDDFSTLVGMPVLYDGFVYISAGRNYDASDGRGRVCCLDPTKRGDISSELEDGAGGVRPNANSGLVWEYLGHSDKTQGRMGRSLSSVVIHQGILIAPDAAGFVHCLDARKGERLWTHETSSPIVGGALIVGETVYVGNDSGTVFLFELSRQKRLIAEREMRNCVEASPVFANGTLYILTRRELVAISN